jgi:hypothetical protein
MTLVSNDVIRANGNRVWVIHCGSCGTAVRGTGASQLQQHADTAAHAAALQSGCGTESKTTAWLREHGPANQMTLISNDNVDARGKRLWVIHCGACGTELRGKGADNFQHHADSATHAAALQSGCAVVSKLAVWIRDHGPGNQMTLVSSEVDSSGRSKSVVRCGACSTDLRGCSAADFQRHADSAAHAAALEGRAALRKRFRS